MLVLCEVFLCAVVVVLCCCAELPASQPRAVQDVAGPAHARAEPPLVPVCVHERHVHSAGGGQRDSRGGDSVRLRVCGFAVTAYASRLQTPLSMHVCVCVLPCLLPPGVRLLLTVASPSVTKAFTFDPRGYVVGFHSNLVVVPLA